MRERILHHLQRLVSFDTQNPPRAITAGTGLFGYLREALGPSFEFETTDLGDGCISLFATRGTPRVLYNFHVDTVPAAPGYSAAPLTLRIQNDRAIGLGACDIKGASACMLASLEGRDDDIALLFTSDEEAGSSRCIKAFCERKLPYELVVVAEPTQARLVTKHRGIFTGTVSFRGRSGHASSGNADRDSALHHAVRWAHAAMEVARGHERREVDGLRGIRFNLGRLEGGVKPNMIAASATIRLGFRPLPGDDAHQIWESLHALPESDEASFETGFVAHSLLSDAALVGAPPGDPVDFWTEAALFGAAGYRAVVFGPGDIAQAHTADEWVAIEQLERVAEIYRAGAPQLSASAT